jgi:hypothetical protein
MATTGVESDEAYARRLQALEMGIRLPPAADAQTPLMLRGGEGGGAGQHAENPTVLNARLDELAGVRLSVYTICLTNTPQVLVACLMLPGYWNEPAYCDEASNQRWKWWVLLSALRMTVFTASVAILYIYRDWLNTRQVYYQRLMNIRNITDAMGLVWFVIGNM